MKRVISVILIFIMIICMLVVPLSAVHNFIEYVKHILISEAIDEPMPIEPVETESDMAGLTPIDKYIVSHSDNLAINQ